MYSFMGRLPMHTVLEEELIFLSLFFSHKCQKILLSDTVIDFCKEWLYVFLFVAFFLIIYYVNCFMHCQNY